MRVAHAVVLEYHFGQTFPGYSRQKAVPSLLSELEIFLATVACNSRNSVPGNALMTSRTAGTADDYRHSHMAVRRIFMGGGSFRQ